MTDEELIARMRLYGSKFHHEFGHNDAADRIEQLVATNEALIEERDRWKDACMSVSRDLNIVVPDNDRLKSERDAAEAKLAECEARLGKAVEALEGLMMHEPDFSDTLWRNARATLAEIKGESHE